MRRDHLQWLLFNPLSKILVSSAGSILCCPRAIGTWHNCCGFWSWTPSLQLQGFLILELHPLIVELQRTHLFALDEESFSTSASYSSIMWCVTCNTLIVPMVSLYNKRQRFKLIFKPMTTLQPQIIFCRKKYIFWRVQIISLTYNFFVPGQGSTFLFPFNSSKRA